MVAIAGTGENIPLRVIRDLNEMIATGALMGCSVRRNDPHELIGALDLVRTGQNDHRARIGVMAVAVRHDGPDDPTLAQFGHE